MKGLLICFFLSSLVSLSYQTEDDFTKDDGSLDASNFNSYNNTGVNAPTKPGKKEILPVSSNNIF